MRTFHFVISIALTVFVSIVAWLMNLVDEFQAIVIGFLLFYGIMLAGINWELYSIRKSVDSHNRFSIIATDLISKIGEAYLGYIEHKNPNRLLHEVMNKLTSAQGKIVKVLMADTEIKYELSPDELKYLLQKYRAGSLTRQEAIRLKELLQAEKEKKEEEGKLADAIFIGLLILGVILLIASLVSED